MEFDLIKPLLKESNSKIIFLVIDGIGGLPRKSDNKTELEAAHKHHLDDLAKEGVCGLHVPVKTGITPGSGPGHLALFGYNPINFQVGRGVLSAYGIDFNLQSDDIAARGNFCTIDRNNVVLDRRAGRIPSEKNRELCRIIQEKVHIPNIQIFVKTEKEHRFLLVLRGKGLSSHIHDTDPQQIGKKPLKPTALKSDADHTSEVVTQFIKQTKILLNDQHPANMVLLRGFSVKPIWPTMQECYRLKSAAIAAYPMYRGLAKLLGMQAIDTGETINDQITTLERHWNEFDFFYIHMKKTDSRGEDGNFEEKKKVIEEIDKFIPRIRALNPDVIIVTGDHSTPSEMAAHSWHPVPVMLWSKHCRPDMVMQFGERACITGGLGPRFPAEDLMTLALANAKRLEKFGA